MASNQVARSDTSYYSGSPARDADYVYVGTMIGPWASAIPVTFTLQRRGRVCQMIIDVEQTAVVTMVTNLITFNPPIPLLFRPASDATGTTIVRETTNYGTPYAPTFMRIFTSGIISLYSPFGAYSLGDTVGVAVNCSGLWQGAP